MEPIFTRELLGQILTILIPLIATALGTVITLYIKRWADDAKETTLGKKTIRYINILEKAAIDVVQGLNQTTVQKLKEAASDGKLTPAEIEEVRADALLQIRAILGATGIEVLSQTVADLNALIACNIERIVLESKKEAA